MRESNFPEVESELRRLRRLADMGLEPELMANFPLLCRLLGRGNPHLAAGGLRDRLSTAASRGDREVLAFLYTLFEGGDSTQRISAAGEKLHVEYRRARDLSDAGIRKMAEHIGSNEDWQVPFMGASIQIRGRRAFVETYVMCARGYVNYRHPRHLVDGSPVEPDYSRSDIEDWDRHLYGPLTIDLTKPRTFRLRRSGTAEARINTFITSDNPRVQVSAQMAYLTFAVEFQFGSTPSDSAQLGLFSTT